ncbi:hypothetical protein LJK87_47985 [Paenibacillus sp. P25]|nr:hypothetical protein LJK87_47985 [Paenibacillus sp. P25]
MHEVASNTIMMKDATGHKKEMAYFSDFQLVMNAGNGLGALVAGALTAFLPIWGLLCRDRRIPPALLLLLPHCGSGGRPHLFSRFVPGAGPVRRSPDVTPPSPALRLGKNRKRPPGLMAGTDVFLPVEGRAAPLQDKTGQDRTARPFVLASPDGYAGIRSSR